MLYLLAYKPILKMLEARRQQIASGLANAEKIKAELARIEAERLDVLTKADAEGKQLIEEARAAAARVQAEETRKAIAAAEQISSGRAKPPSASTPAMLAELKHEVGRLVRADDRDGHRQDPDAGGSAPPRRGDRAAAGELERHRSDEESDKRSRTARGAAAVSPVPGRWRAGRGPRAPGRRSASPRPDAAARWPCCRTSSGWCGSIATGTQPLVESATPLAADLRDDVQAGLHAVYGPASSHRSQTNPALIGGMRIKVGSDVYDDSVRARLAALEARVCELGRALVEAMSHG